MRISSVSIAFYCKSPKEEYVFTSPIVCILSIRRESARQCRADSFFVMFVSLLPRNKAPYKLLPVNGEPSLVFFDVFFLNDFNDFPVLIDDLHEGPFLVNGGGIGAQHIV